ncbi:MAG: transglutaminase domain-containing protein [Deltaproteobacteria bacterium]|nr:transglutaminase domain-containing protein [Deltaproteobacteria bacterium]
MKRAANTCSCLCACLLLGCGSSPGPQPYEWTSVEGSRLEDLLTDEARQAVQSVPAWLRDPLALSFARLGGGDQRRFAQVILEPADPRHVDEIAFVVAHSSRADLRSDLYDPALLAHNAALIYERADSLPYVELVELEDGTTLRYILPARPVVIPREIYYWYVVHPRLEDDSPVYLEPESNRTEPPPTGRFWRQSLFDQADPLCPDDIWCPEDPFANASACPVLGEMLASERYLWKGRRDDSDDNGAVGAVARWVRASMCFGAGSERPVQPVRIYFLHRGNCGEYADLTSAALRAALIPAINVAAYSNDHTWNQFFDGLWHQIEPVNDMVDSPIYDRDGPDGDGWWWLYATYYSRGDGWTIDNQDFYSDQNCTLVATVTDAAGLPVEGARIISGTWRMGFVPHFLGLSDENGQVEAVLGDHNDYFLWALSPLGNVPEDDPVLVISGSEPGQTYTWDVQIPGRLPVLPIGPAAEPEGDWRLEVELDFPARTLHASGLVAGLEFARRREPGRVRAFVCAPAQCAAYRAGQAFEAHGPGAEGRMLGTDAFGLDLDEPEGWELVLSNEEALIATQLGRVRIALRRRGELAAETGDTVYLAPGERFVYRIGPAQGEGAQP